MAENTYYKVGDCVQIREDLKEDAYYGMFDGVTKDTAVRNMLPYAKAITKITKIECDKYRIDIDNGRHFWTDKMFESKVNTAYDEVGLKYAISIGNEFFIIVTKIKENEGVYTFSVPKNLPPFVYDKLSCVQNENGDHIFEKENLDSFIYIDEFEVQLRRDVFGVGKKDDNLKAYSWGCRSVFFLEEWVSPISSRLYINEIILLDE